MKRKILQTLAEWKNSEYRKPLILEGARQVGKTYSVLEFARQSYDNVAHINFELQRDAAKIFEESLDPLVIIPAIAHFTKQTITQGRTLIFFDEIQQCPAALTSLKYFNEFHNSYHIIAAGSLLGIAVSREKYSFPVGKVTTKVMYPLDFEEFLWALGETELTGIIRSCYETNSPTGEYYHAALLDYYRNYLLVGGMPSVVSLFAETRDMNLVRAEQSEILNNYLADMSKYNTENEIKKTRLTYESVSGQLSKRNTKFQYKLIKKGGRASEFENAIEWLSLSGITFRVFLIEHIKKPLEDNKDIDGFKIYFSDVGLLCANRNIYPGDIMYEAPELNDFKGGLAENYVCQALTASGHKLYSWQSEGIAEIDFIFQDENGHVIPVEVKSADNTQAKSLMRYMKSANPEYAIKISSKNFGYENNIKTVPLYAVFCI